MRLDYFCDYGEGISIKTLMDQTLTLCMCDISYIKVWILKCLPKFLSQEISIQNWSIAYQSQNFSILLVNDFLTIMLIV